MNCLDLILKEIENTKNLLDNNIKKTDEIYDENDNLLCYDILSSYKQFNMKVYGIKLIIHSSALKKSLIIFGIVDDVIVDYLNNRLPIDLDNLEERKYDEDDYLHWIFQFKDITIDRYLNNKPRPPLYPKICNAPLALMTHLSDMRLKFIQNNKDLRYYLIKVHFSAKIQKPGAKTLEFYNPYRGMWQSRNRMWDPYIGPCCA
jgi:hypothetical protein